MTEASRRAPDAPVRVGTSACLLGHEVRYDGGHKRARFVTDVLARHLVLVPVCPEVEAGMGVPREPVRLVGDAEAPRMLGTRSETDWTRTMRRYAAERVAADDLAALSGFILKKGSPSCGMERVRVYGLGAVPSRNGVGLFAQALRERHPLLPVEEEGRLEDRALRDHFLVRVFAFHRWRELLASQPRRADLIAFHARHKYLLLAHSPAGGRELGRLVARVAELGLPETKKRYADGFMKALSIRTTVRKHVDVLLHILGFLREHLSPAARQDVLAVIEDYRKGLVPLVAPVTLLRHYVIVHDVPWIRDQVYLAPDPREVALRSPV